MEPNETNPQAPQDPAAAAAAAEAAQAGKGKGAKTRSVQKADGFKSYVTSEKHTIPIDILVHGETIHGQWSAKDGLVEFSVPDRLVEGFEMHYHFKSGNIVAAE